MFFEKKIRYSLTFFATMIYSDMYVSSSVYVVALKRAGCVVEIR